MKKIDHFARNLQILSVYASCGPKVPGLCLYALRIFDSFILSLLY